MPGELSEKSMLRRATLVPIICPAPPSEYRQKGAKRDRMTSRRPLGSRQKSIQEVFWSKQAWVSRASSRGRDRIKRPNLGGSKSTPKVPQESGLEPNTGVRPFVIIKMLWQTCCRQMTNFLLAMWHLHGHKGPGAWMRQA